MRVFLRRLKGVLVSDSFVTFLLFMAPIVGISLVVKYRYEIALWFLRGWNTGFSGIREVLGDFFTLTFGVLVEAFPFVVLGVLVSVMVQVFLPSNLLFRLLPKGRILRRLAVSISGLLMPVCECGNVPVARSLLVRGFSVQESIVFLLAAPSVNFITILVTLEAFNFNKSVAVVRVIATLIIANIAAYLVVKLLKGKKILTDDFKAHCQVEQAKKRSFPRALQLFRSEMWLITKMLCIGAMIAAASQTFVPADVITTIGSSIFLSVVAMLVLAFVISICSSVDSFFALAYVGTFPLGAVTAFLIAGPMVDIKMIALMKTTYTYRAITIMTATVFALSLMVGLVLSYVW